MAILFIYAENPDLKTLLENQVNKHRHTDSGFDIPLLEQIINENTVRDGDYVQYTFNLGIKVAAVKNNVPMPCLLLPRSSLSKTPLRLSNSLGLIDAGYRGEVKAVTDVLNFRTNTNVHISAGSREFQLCQHDFLPWNQIRIVNALEELPQAPDNRGEGGFGSTGH
jgi:dUTP pyrophosphatase